MTKREKLKERLITRPTDFTWEELKSLLLSFGYKESNVGKTSGSRVRFISEIYLSLMSFRYFRRLDFFVPKVKKDAE